MTKWVNGCEVHDKPDEQMRDDVKFMTNQTNRCTMMRSS